MTKIELIQKKRRERLWKMEKGLLIKLIEKAAIFGDTYTLLKEANIPMQKQGIENTLKSMIKTFD